MVAAGSGGRVQATRSALRHRPAMDFVTGYARAGTDPSTNINGEARTLVGLGNRHAAYDGTTVALCGQSLALVVPEMTFSRGGLGAEVCARCEAKVDQA